MNSEDAAYHAQFAEIYDAIRAAYLDVDADCGQLLAATEATPGETILDLGSGTGIHALALARRGYRVIAIEPAPSMYAIAHRRLKGLPSIEIHRVGWSDLASALAERQVGVAVSFANVLNCMSSEADMLAALSSLRRALRPGGRALIDVWNRTPIDASGTHDTVRVLATEFGDVIQTSVAELDGALLRIHYRIFVPEPDGRHRQVESTHELMLLEPNEYRALFAAAGLDARTVLSQRPRSTEPGGGEGSDLQSWVLQRPL